MKTGRLCEAYRTGVLALALVATGAFAEEDSSPLLTDMEGAKIENIVVTAQRREENLQDVPIAITALSAEQLSAAGIDGAAGLSLVTPGLYYAGQGPFAQPTIRGVGTSLAGPSTDANVAIYVDGIYQPNQIANLFDFNNIERIEVLKGPQGTLFGRNATGGAINITTFSPTAEPRADVTLSYGRFNDFKATAYATGGITDTLSANVAVLYRNDDGYVKNVLLNKRMAKIDEKAVRAKLLYRPVDDLSITLTGNYSDSSNNAPYAVEPVNRNNVNVRTNPNLLIPPAIREVALDTDPEATTKSKGISLHVQYDRPWGRFTSITAYQDVEPYLLSDIDNSAAPASTASIPLSQETFTQEFNFASDFDSAVNWIAGLFYYDDTADLDLFSYSGIPRVLVATVFSTITTEAAAAYGEINYDVSDRLRLIGGVRYSYEKKHASGGIPAAPNILNSEEDWSAWTPRASIRYALTPDSNIYFTYSRGFKSGNYNGVALSNTPVDPETVNAYEIGYKLAAPRLSLNASAYYYDYKDIQVQIQTNLGGNVLTLYQNAATAKIYGADLDLTAVLTDRWRAQVGLAYTHARYDKYKDALITTPAVDPVTGLPIGGNVQTAGDASDKEMIRTPELTANVTLTYHRPLQTGALEASVTGAYNSGFFWDPGNRVEQDAYTLVNAQLTWISPQHRYRVSLWGQNLTDETYVIYGNTTGTGDSAAYGRPITYGISVSASLR